MNLKAQEKILLKRKEKFKIILSFVFATGTMMNANIRNKKEIIVSLEIAPPGWDCSEWSDFMFEWEKAWGASFEDAADIAQQSFDECEGQ